MWNYVNEDKYGNKVYSIILRNLYRTVMLTEVTVTFLKCKTNNTVLLYVLNCWYINPFCLGHNFNSVSSRNLLTRLTLTTIILAVLYWEYYFNWDHDPGWKVLKASSEMYVLWEQLMKVFQKKYVAWGSTGESVLSSEAL